MTPAQNRPQQPSRSGVALLLFLSLAAGRALAQRFDLGPQAAPTAPSAVAPGPLWIRPEHPLYDNGPLVNRPDRGVDGADESVLQESTLDMVVLGFACHPDFEARVADDFIVPYNEMWQLDRATFFSYQTGIVSGSTITGLNLRLWNGRPMEEGSEVIFGDTTTNRLTASAWTGMYRVFEHLSGIAADRAVMANTIDLPLLLPPGQYWLDFQLEGSLTSGPWCPPVTLVEKALTGNAVSSVDNGLTYITAQDPGPDAPQGLPFLLEGRRLPLSLEVPAASAGGLTALGGLLAAAGLGLLRRRGRRRRGGRR